MANIFEFLSKDGNITPVKARKSRQMQFHDKTAYVWMGKARKSRQMQFRDKTAYVWGLRYRGTRFPGSRTLCYPGGGWTPSLQFFSSQRGGALALLRGGLGLSMEGLEGGGGAEEARKGGTEAFGQLDSKVKVLSLSCARIFCSFCNCDQCLKRARLS